jgi:hypothetical protein
MKLKQFMGDCGSGDGMGMSRRMRVGLTLVALSACAGALGQSMTEAVSSLGDVASRPGTNPITMQATGEVVREIDDPHSGARWFLMRDPSHPGGPGRMALAVRPGVQALNNSRSNPRIGTQNDLRHYRLRNAPAQPAIRAGDSLVVEENTAVVETRLEAVALNPAAIGSPLNVRLAIGGKVVRAVAVAPGRAAFEAVFEVKP